MKNSFVCIKMVSSVSKHGYELFLNVDKTFDIPDEEGGSPPFIDLISYLCEYTAYPSQVMWYNMSGSVEWDSWGWSSEAHVARIWRGFTSDGL